MWKKVVLGFLLLAGLALIGGYLVTDKQSTSGSAVANASPESTAPLAGPTSEPPVVSPSATPFDPAQGKLRTGTAEPTVEIVTATPCDTCPDKGQPAATDTPAPALPPAPIPGHPAPDFALPDLAGNEMRLSDLRGQVVLVNFWATW